MLGSPYNSFHNAEDYEFSEDRFDDGEDDRENEDPQAEDSDEDTEEASETDMGRNEEPLEIKEQMYQDKLASLKKQLQQLKDGTHQEYNRRVKKLEYQYKERLRLNIIYKEYLEECVEREYVHEKKIAAKELEEKKVELKENLLVDLEEKRKAIESERYTMELTGDAIEPKPVMTRKLRRRPNDPAPVPEKRRKPPTAQLVYLLDDRDIDNDLRQINRGGVNAGTKATGGGASAATGGVASTGGGASGGTGRPAFAPNPTTPVQQPQIETPLVETKVEDGKLLYERRWFHRGQSVYVEGRDYPRFAANISAINNEVIWVKKNDGTKFRIFTSQLARGKISIKRRAA